VTIASLDLKKASSSVLGTSFYRPSNFATVEPRTKETVPSERTRRMFVVRLLLSENTPPNIGESYTIHRKGEIISCVLPWSNHIF